MRAASDTGGGLLAEPPPLVHPLHVRIAHWINAGAVVVMIGSGWQIYNASPLFSFEFPKAATLGGWLGGGLLWHFLEPTGPKEKSARIAPAVGPGFAGLSLTGKF